MFGEYLTLDLSLPSVYKLVSSLRHIRSWEGAAQSFLCSLATAAVKHDTARKHVAVSYMFENVQDAKHMEACLISDWFLNHMTPRWW